MRKSIVKVVADPPLSTRMYYLVKITHIEIKRKPDGIAVTVQHLSAKQEGRCHKFILSLPLRLSSRAALFLAACGIDIAIGQEIEPKSVVGTIIEMRLSLGKAGEYQPAEFRRIESNENGIQDQGDT